MKYFTIFVGTLMENKIEFFFKNNLIIFYKVLEMRYYSPHHITVVKAIAVIT